MKTKSLLAIFRQANLSQYPDSMNDAVYQAARLWWKSHRPTQWSEAQHLAQPTVNCTSASERRLASSVAKELNARRLRALSDELASSAIKERRAA